MRIVTANTAAAFAVAAFLACPTVASALSDLNLTVDCGSGASINGTLSRPTLFDRRLVVTVNGTCNENVTLQRDDVVLRAQTSGSGVNATDAPQPPILINGATRVLLDGLTVVGGNNGVKATGAAAITIRNSIIRNAVTNGVLVNGRATAVVQGSTIENNGQVGVVADGSSIKMTDSTVQGNGFSGVVSARGSDVILGDTDSAGTVCCGNQIVNNARDGVTVVDSASATLYGNTVQGNGGSTSRFGILVLQGSSVWLRGGNVVHGNGSANGGGGVFARGASVRTGAGDPPLSPTTNEISNNAFGMQGSNNSYMELQGGLSITGSTFTGVVVDAGSRLRTAQSTISGNGALGIFVARGSSAEFLGSANVVTGNSAVGLYCADSESYYSGNVTGITGNGGGDVVNCMNYSLPAPPATLPPPLAQ
jgi:parallel beta-helix repeat protein